MLSFKNSVRFRLVPLLLLVCSGCSFNYLYTPEVEEHINKTFVMSIPDREGQILRNELRFLFEKHDGPKVLAYNLETKLSLQYKSIGIQRDATTSRNEIVAIAHVTLKDRETHRILYQNKIRAINSFVVRRALFYANPTTEQYATKQALELLAHLIKADLSTYFTKNENSL